MVCFAYWFVAFSFVCVWILCGLQIVELVFVCLMLVGCLGFVIWWS